MATRRATCVYTLCISAGASPARDGRDGCVHVRGATGLVRRPDNQPLPRKPGAQVCERSGLLPPPPPPIGLTFSRPRRARCRSASPIGLIIAGIPGRTANLRGVRDHRHAVTVLLAAPHGRIRADVSSVMAIEPLPAIIIAAREGLLTAPVRRGSPVLTGLPSPRDKSTRRSWGEKKAGEGRGEMRGAIRSSVKSN